MMRRLNKNVETTYHWSRCFRKQVRQFRVRSDILTMYCQLR